MLHAPQKHMTHTEEKRAGSTIRGFTLIELLVSVAIISLLSSLVLASMNTARKGARDAQRLSSLREIQTALELYYNEHGAYPDGDDAGIGGWDTPENGDFIAPLVDEEFIRAHLQDPLGVAFATNLRYKHYATGDEGCPVASGGFYVLGIADMENSEGPHVSSPGFACDTRDWQDEMEFVMGKFER